MTRSVPHHLRRCSCGRGVCVPGPARTCAPRPGRTSARGRTDRSRSCRFTHGPLPVPLAQVLPLVEVVASTWPLAGIGSCEGLLTLFWQGLPNTHYQRAAIIPGSIRAIVEGWHTVRIADAERYCLPVSCSNLILKNEEQIDGPKWPCVTAKIKPESCAFRSATRARG